MAGKEVRIHNKSDKPDNIVKKEAQIFQECEEIEKELPRFLKGFYLFKRKCPAHVQAGISSRYSFFCNYLISETDLTAAKQTSEITLKEFEDIKAVDINIYLDYCRKYKVETDKNIYVYENNNKTLARKKSSVSVMFKQLYRDQLISKNITDGFDPIRVPKAGEKGDQSPTGR